MELFASLFEVTKLPRRGANFLVLLAQIRFKWERPQLHKKIVIEKVWIGYYVGYQEVEIMKTMVY